MFDIYLIDVCTDTSKWEFLAELILTTFADLKLYIFCSTVKPLQRRHGTGCSNEPILWSRSAMLCTLLFFVLTSLPSAHCCHLCCALFSAFLSALLSDFHYVLATHLPPTLFFLALFSALCFLTLTLQFPVTPMLEEQLGNGTIFEKWSLPFSESVIF